MTIKAMSEYLSKRGVPYTGCAKKDLFKDKKPLFFNQLKGLKMAIETAGIIYK